MEPDEDAARLQKKTQKHPRLGSDMGPWTPARWILTALGGSPAAGVEAQLNMALYEDATGMNLPKNHPRLGSDVGAWALARTILTALAGSPAAGVEAQLNMEPDEDAAGVPKMLPAALLAPPNPVKPPNPPAWLEAGEVREKGFVLPPKAPGWPKEKPALEAGVAPKGWEAVWPKVGIPKPGQGR